MSGPLQGLRVLDLCHFLAGPYATVVLADLGADVIKIEDPDHPDEARSLGPCFQDGQSLYFASLNWAKRSFSVRFASEEGRRVALELVQTADVVVDNFRPGVMRKIGLTGFGETGPYAARAGYDYTIQALAGVMSLTGEPDAAPGKAGISYVDHAGGLAAALGVCAAVLERERTGRGQHIDVGLFDVQISMLTYVAAWQLNSGFSPPRTPSGSHPSIVPAQTFRTRDGHISIFVGNDPMWARLVSVLGDSRLADPRFVTSAGRYEHRERVLEILQEIFERGDNAHWVEELSARSVPCAPVNGLADALADPQVAARGLVNSARTDGHRPYRHVRGPLCAMAPAVERGAPLPGADTVSLLRELGYDDQAIARLVEAGLVADAESRPLVSADGE
jgi:crotonobetainyl-CoA:carnitine CoA-transferase CaiB-like acyl-CoA transferase